MTSSMSQDPIHIGYQQLLAHFFLAVRQPGEPPLVVGTLATLHGGVSNIVLDAIRGEKGDPGEARSPFRIQYDQIGIVTSEEDLPNTATLDASDEGRAWWINGFLYVYSDLDGDFHKLQGSIQGPAGATPDISFSARAVEAQDPDGIYGPIPVNETGGPLSPHYEIEIPLLPGPPGPSAAIESAADYDDDVSAEDGDYLRYNATTEKWAPSSPTLLQAQMYTIPESSFVEYTGGAGRQLIASLNVPAQDFEWYPDVIGHIRIARSGLLSTAQVEVEVRIGDTGLSGTGETSPLCGLAPHDPTMQLFDSVTIAHIAPHFSDVSDPLRAIAPDSAAARVPEGQAKTIYVFLHKIAGSGSYQFTKAGAQLRLKMEPVA